ncbi:MAG: sulfotransferase [Hyphomonas sp.]|nr:sulfotransferase [Hyphomonas sp.]MCB9960633.1 sulfotransferase [Hyphomonas sp.]
MPPADTKPWSARTHQGIGPDAVVIGAMRAGTTTLYRMLDQTGLVSVAESKETDYYLKDEFRARGEAWYRRQFRNSELPWIDICPNYTKRIVFPGVPDRIHADAPGVPLVFIARDPVKRVISQYNHTFMTRKDLPKPADLLDSNLGMEILESSRYAFQLKPYYDLWPRDRILVVSFRELLRQPTETLHRILQHIGVEAPEDLEIADLSADNTSHDLRSLPLWWGQLRRTRLGRYLKSHAPRKLIDFSRRKVSSDRLVEFPAFDHDTQRRIADLLHEDVSEFRRLTGLSFSHWSV